MSTKQQSAYYLLLLISKTICFTSYSVFIRL